MYSYEHWNKKNLAALTSMVHPQMCTNGVSASTLACKEYNT